MDFALEILHVRQHIDGKMSWFNINYFAAKEYAQRARVAYSMGRV